MVLENSQNSTKFDFLVGPSAEAENRVSIDILNLRDRVFSGSMRIIDSSLIDNTMTLLDAGLTNLSEDTVQRLVLSSIGLITRFQI